MGEGKGSDLPRLHPLLLVPFDDHVEVGHVDEDLLDEFLQSGQ